MHTKLFCSNLLTGDELGIATVIDSLLVSSGLTTPNFTHQERRFLNLSYGFYAEMMSTIGTSVFSWISRRDRVGF